jgi:hypothetical protein
MGENRIKLRMLKDRAFITGLVVLSFLSMVSGIKS